MLLQKPQKSSPNSSIEARPAYVEDWLYTLPYADFLKAAQLLEHALNATNKQQLKPSTRFELLELYARPYQYLLDSYIKIKPAAKPGLRNAETLHRNVEAIKRIAAELAHGSRLAINHTLARKSLWRPAKSPTRLIVMAIKFLSHILVLSYHQYSPPPKAVWKEIHALYHQAEQLGQDLVPVDDPEQGPAAKTTIRHAYQQIIATASLDHYQLPYGAIWEIYEQLYEWASELALRPFQIVRNPAGHFVVDLKDDRGPVSYLKFKAQGATEHYRLVDCKALYRTAQQQLERICQDHSPEGGLVLFPEQAGLLLTHMLKAWGLLPTRYSPRYEQSGLAEIAWGCNATYFFINAGKEFNVKTNWGKDTLFFSSFGTAQYLLETWLVPNKGPDGVALYPSEKPKSLLRVGELVGIKPLNKTGHEAWVIGVVRWLRIEANQLPKLGIQILAKQPMPVAVRAIIGSRADIQYRRAFLISLPGQDHELSLITAPKGLFIETRRLEIHVRGRQLQVETKTLQESTAAFEQFSCRIIRII